MMILIRRMMMLIGLLVLLSIPVQAQTNGADDKAVDDFLELFDKTSDDLVFTDFGNVWDDYQAYFYSGSQQDLNQFERFSFSGGLDFKRISTFSEEKTLVGYGDEGTLVGLLVYREDDGDIVMIDSSLKTLGASGLYSERISFDCEQVQYLMVAVMQEGLVQSRIYQITTKKVATKVYLENFDIDFIPSDLVPTTVPDFVLPELTGIDF